MSGPAGRDELRLASARDKWVERREVDPCADCAEEMANENQRLRKLLAEIASDIGDAMERLKS